MKIGDLVKMKYGYSQNGIILGFEAGNEDRQSRHGEERMKWARVYWSDDGPGLEKLRDIEVINECG